MGHGLAPSVGIDLVLSMTAGLQWVGVQYVRGS